VIDRADGHRDHLAFELGQAAVAQHQIVDHVDECFQLVGVEGIRLQYVGHESQLFHAFVKIALQLGRKLGRLSEIERRDVG
jgi:hypothetical protein